jgi:hypothetical protein
MVAFANSALLLRISRASIALKHIDPFIKMSTHRFKYADQGQADLESIFAFSATAGKISFAKMFA